jgi:hypothetical protein
MAVSRGYTYPVQAAAAIPAAHHRLSHLRLILVAGGALVLGIVLVTLIAVLARPTTPACGFFCGPRVGPRLLSPVAYHNTMFGYTVEYDSSQLTIAGQDDNGVQLQAADGDGEVIFTSAAGADVNGANQTALGALPSATFQDVQPNGPVRGAEIGFVNGSGTAYTAQFVPANGGQAVPIGITIFSASSNGVTITVTAFSAQSNSNSDAPYGLDKASSFDLPVSNTIWKGQQ